MRLTLAAALLASLCTVTLTRAAETVAVDVCVYGGTSGGVAAAVVVAREGKSVILVEPGKHLGGMTTGGLGHTDFGNKRVIGGISRTFYQQLGKHYGKEEVWQFEPGVAERLYRNWVTENKVRVLLEHRINVAEKKGTAIARIVLDHAPPEDNGAPAARARHEKAVVIEAKVFVDATYEGDLLAKAGVKYHVGREAVSTYGESLNGIRAQTPKHQFVVPTDPYVKPGDPSSGLLPLIQSGDGGKAGDGDRSVQAYNFRMCLTNRPENRIAITAPEGYDEKRYELLGRYLDTLLAHNRKPSLGMLLKIDMMPNGKTDINNNGAVSTDFIGKNYEYPEGTWETRNRTWKEHQRYIRGLFYYLQNSTRVPEYLRNDAKQWGFAKDEFVDTGGWPHQMYVREARRMVGRYVITQADCEHRRSIDDSVGMGAYNMDSHNCQRVVKKGAGPGGMDVVENEGDVQVAPRAPYAISYRSITPKAEECSNLVVPVAFSSSHIAYGSARMEPVFMVLGESSAYAACQAIDDGKTVQEIDYPKLKERLLKAGQVLYLPPGEVQPSAKRLNPAELKGVVVDDSQAVLTGEWDGGSSVGPFVSEGYRHDGNAEKGSRTARYEAKLPAGGRYEVRISYSTHENRATNVPVTVRYAGGEKTIKINQRKAAAIDGVWQSLGTFEFRKDRAAIVVISNAGTDGHVILDAVQFLPVE